MATKSWLGGTNNSANDASTASNWLPSGVPTNSDDVYVESNPGGTDYSISAGLSAFVGITLASFNVSQTYTGQIGTTGTSNSYIQLGGTNSSSITVNVGYQYGGSSPASGSNLLKIDTGAMLTTYNVQNSAASSALAGSGPVSFLGTHTSNTLNVILGQVSAALYPTEVSQFRTINCSGNLSLGPGVTLTNGSININGGTCLIQSSTSTVNLSAGSVYTYGSGTITSLSVNQGTAILNSNGTITTLNVESGTANFSGDPRTKTVTTMNLYSGAIINLNNGVKNSITISNPINTFALPGQVTITAWANSSFAIS